MTTPTLRRPRGLIRLTLSWLLCLLLAATISLGGLFAVAYIVGGNLRGTP